MLDRLIGKGIRIAHDRGDRSGPNVVDHMHVVTAEAVTHTTMNAPEAAQEETSPALISAAEAFLRRLPYGRAPHVWG